MAKEEKNEVKEEVIMKDKFIEICDSAIFDYDKFYIVSKKIDKIRNVLEKYLDCREGWYFKLMMALHHVTIHSIGDRIIQLRDHLKTLDESEFEEFRKIIHIAISMDIFKRIYNEDETIYNEISKQNYIALMTSNCMAFDLTVFTILLASGIIDEIPEKIVNRFNEYVNENNIKCGHICMDDFKILVEEK